MAAPQPLLLPARVPVVPPLLAVAFTLLVVGLLAADTAGQTVGVGRSDAVAATPSGPPAGATSLPITDVVSTYHVRPGDTLATIAAVHAVPMGELAAANRLAPPYPLSSGQALAVPVPGVPAPLLPGAVSLAAPLGPSIERWAAEYDLPAELLKAVTWRESRWRADAVSSRGAVGVGQVLPETAAWVSDHLIGRPLDPWRVEENLQLSAAYLRWLIDRSGGDTAAALAAYHQGRTSVIEDGWFAVTERYVRDVFDLRWRFEAAQRG